MYSYFIKGFTVGHVLTRKLLRTLTGIPGLIIDAILALFWLPDYSAYWNEGAQIYYLDDVMVSPVRGLTGWIGEIAGFIIGIPLGLLLALPVFITDSVLRVCRILQLALYSNLDHFANFVGKASFFQNFQVFDEPANFLQKCWNIGAAVFGSILAIVPYILAKSIEFFIPVFGEGLSKMTTQVSGIFGGVLLSTFGILLFPVSYIVNKIGELYDLTHDKCQKIIAIIYAKSGETPADGNDCFSAVTMHSNEFRNEVEAAKKSTWAQLIFGPLKRQNDPFSENVVLNIDPFTSTNDASPVDPITLEDLGKDKVTVLVDKCGHSFNDYSRTTQKGIHFWLENHSTCPLGKELLIAADLVPNYALNKFLASRK